MKHSQVSIHCEVFMIQCVHASLFSVKVHSCQCECFMVQCEDDVRCQNSAWRFHVSYLGTRRALA